MSLAAGTKLGRYEVRSKLGEGGMGEVYLAEDTQLHRKVALKVLPAEAVANQDRMRRFIQEAQAAAALNHPNIAHIYEIGESEGTNFIAMEFVEGLPLNAKVGGRPLLVSEIVHLGTQLADALNEAHSKGITHRDVKPSNVMITPRGQARLLDFGLAKFRRSIPEEYSSDATTQLKTAEGIVIGTVVYMSPEQALGQLVDHRSDIFSLGAVLYEMATGRLPFTGSTATEIIDHIAHSQPDAISRFNYAVPSELERIIRKCLEKDKERRYQSARELLVDLENLKRDSTAEGVSSEKVATPRQENVHLRTLTAVALILVVLTGVGIYLLRHRSQPVETTTIDSIAVLPLVNASGGANMEYLSDGITESIINSLSQVPGLRVVPRVSVFRYKGREIDPQAVARALGVRAVLTGRVVQFGDRLSIQTDLVDVEKNSQLWGAKYDRQLSDLLAVQDEIANEISNKLRLRLSDDEQHQLTKRFTKDAEAYQLYLKGRYHWKKYTKDGLEKSIDYFNQAIERDPRYALAYSGLADAYVVLGIMYLPPNQAFPNAKAAAQKALAIDENLAAGHISMGAYKLFYEWDWAGAQREAQRAKELNAGYAKAIEINTNYDDDHHFYCQALDTIGKPQDSIAEMRRALELDPFSLSMNMEMGWSFYVARDYDQAISQCRQVIEMDPNFIAAYSCTAQAYEQKKMYAEAIADMNKARALVGDSPGVIEELACAYALSGQKGEAHKLLDALKQRSVLEYVDPGLIALIYTSLGEKDQAFAWLEKAYQMRSSGMTWLKVEPKFDPLRSDPRFTDLMRRVGIT
jgi:serine/threonine protein kinase/Tfp pilus assembly protein PilF